MKATTLIITALTFLLACGQTNQNGQLIQNNTEEIKKDKNISELWSLNLQQLDFASQLNADEIERLTFDLSDILVYKKGDNERLSWFIGALGQNFQKVDIIVLSAKHLGEQTYFLKLLFKNESNIDTLTGEMNLKTVFELPEDIHKIYICSFSYSFRSSDNTICLEGTNAVSFYVEDSIPKNYWYDDGSFNDYVRTFVGTKTNNTNGQKMNCVFAVSPAGLYNSLPFCEDLYWVDEEDNPEYYYIKDEYKQNGWQDFETKDPKTDKWWKE
jgi:hypothetical protein